MELSPEALAEFFSTMRPLLDERQRRLMAGALATAFGRGGPTWVADASGLSRNTVLAGVDRWWGGASRGPLPFDFTAQSKAEDVPSSVSRLN